MAFKTLHSDRVHYGWDRGIEPAMRVGCGEAVRFEIIDAGGGQVTAASTAAVFDDYDSTRVNPVTGPVWIDGAKAGDVLVVDVEEFSPSGWGWTAIIPGFGLLADQFTRPLLHISQYTRRYVDFIEGVRIPTRPFTGTIGVAPAAAGRHDVIPPRRVGGNMDVRDLVRGARLLLPIEVDGALFSVGDTHAAQGDGEVCGTAVESPIDVRLRFDVRRDLHLNSPQIIAPPNARPRFLSPTYLTTGIGSDLMTAARDATRAMIDHVHREYGIEEAMAYCLCSVAADLRISEIVDAPNWVVSMAMPTGIFV